jgi:hypothetical protein
MKKFLLLTVLITSFVFAGKGSIYSQFGLGEINTFISGKNIGMGKTGIATFGETHINLANPASTMNITRTILSVSYQYQSYRSGDTSGTSIFGTGNINTFALAFPVYAPKKMVLTLGIVPFSSVAYEQQQSQTLLNGTTVNQTFDGRGGITSGQLSLSYAVNPDVSIGVTTHYLFGTIHKDQTVNFNSTEYYNGSYHETKSLGGFALTLGGIYSGIDKALGFSDTKEMNVGFTLFSGSTLDYDDEQLLNYSTNQDTMAANNKTINLPAGFSFGLAYLKNKMVYAADVHFQNWDNFKIEGIHPAEIQNSIQLGAGIEFLPQSDFIGDEYIKRLSYRFGGYYRKTNLKLNGNSIDEIFGSAGISLPMSVETRIHLALEYGIRGTTSSSLIKDTLLRFTVSVSASELMFVQPEIE